MTAKDNPNTGSFRLSRSGDTSKDLLVKVQVSGTATYGTWATDDYTLDRVHTGLTGYFVTIPSGMAFNDIVCTPFHDGTNEDTETVTLTVAEYIGYTVGPRAQATALILDAPDSSAAGVTFRIEVDARPAHRCWPVDAAERRLPRAPQDILHTSEPYVFSLADMGEERTAGVSWELSYDIRTEEGTLNHQIETAGGTTFPRTFSVNEERVTVAGATMPAGWHVRFFVNANRNGRRDAEEAFTDGQFDDVLQDRKAIWLCRLEEEKKAHAGTIYNEIFGVTAFFDQLITTVKNVNFGRNSDPNAQAIYGFMADTIGVNDVENIEEDIDTIIHESIHALDDACNSQPNAFPTHVHIDTVEAIAWTAQHLLNRKAELKILRDFEDALGTSHPDSLALEARCKMVVRVFHLFTNSREIGQPWPLQDRPLTLDDVQTTRAAVGLHYNMANLMVSYQQRLNDAGEPVFLTSSVQIGPDRYEIPPVFLE